MVEYTRTKLRKSAVLLLAVSVRKTHGTVLLRQAWSKMRFLILIYVRFFSNSRYDSRDIEKTRSCADQLELVAREMHELVGQ